MHLPNGTFILTVTRFSPEKEQNKKVSVKRKSSFPNNSLSIYSFNNFEDYLEFCTYLNNSLNNNTSLTLKESSLYQYNSKYYLCIKMTTKNSNIFKIIHYAITEFGSHINNSDLFERKLIEYGTAIFKTNAINNCIKYFKQKH